MKVGILGNGRRGIGSRLLAALSHGGRWLAGDQRKGVAVNPFYRKWNTDTDAVRSWHNPADLVQAARIEAAEAKRERKADKLEGHANTHWGNNYAHNQAFHTLDEATGYIAPLNLNPFYIAK